MKLLIYPSLAAADQLNLQREIERVENYIDGFHIDIMDDHFVPNVAMSVGTTNQIAHVTKKPLFIHLMVEYVAEFIERFQLPAGTTISFHSQRLVTEEQETVPGVWTEMIPTIAGVFEKIKRSNWKVSIALCPGQPISTIAPLLAQVDNVLVLSVMPGFSGQDFMPISLNTLDDLVLLRKENNLNFSIAIDGGIDAKNINQVALHGAHIVCVGSGIFGEQDPVKAIELLREQIS